MTAKLTASLVTSSLKSGEYRIRFCSKGNSVICGRSNIHHSDLLPGTPSASCPQVLLVSETSACHSLSARRAALKQFSVNDILVMNSAIHHTK